MAGGDKRIRIEDDGVDRFTELPVNLREHILDCLSIKDAVATSVLSSKWRYCWTGLRKLVFYDEFWKFGEESTVLEHARAIDRVLMRHSGPIREFILFIPDLKGLFTCQELEELSLSNCKVTLPSDFKGFSNLTSLSLDDVDIASSILGSLIFGCPLLEALSITNLVLKEPLALETLNIKTFDFNGCDIGKIVFKDVPKLTCVSLLAMRQPVRIDDPQPYNTLERLCSLSMIKELTYDLFLLEPLLENCPSSISTPLQNLKCLTLRHVNIRLSEDILFTLCLLGSAPNLQNLTIDLYWEYGDRFDMNKEKRAAAKLLKSEARKHTSYNSLQTIKISGIEGLPHEILLFKLLQTRCRKVKSIIIETGH